MVTTKVSVVYGVLLIIVVLGGPCCTCLLHSLLVIDLASFCHFMSIFFFACGRFWNF